MKKANPILPLCLVALGVAPAIRSLGAVPVAAGRASTDQVIKVSGEVMKGVEVLSENLAEVTFKRRGKEEKLRASEIKTIVWGDTPSAFARAEIAADRGDYYTAANLFEEAASQSKREAFKAAAGFRAVQSLIRDAGANRQNAATASSAADAWVSAHAKHRLLPEALRLLGDGKMLAEDPKGAEAAYSKLEKLAGAEGLSTIWIGRAKLGQARALVEQKAFGRARQVYVSAYSTVSRLDPKKEPEAIGIGVTAKIGEGECYLAENRFQDAKSYFQRLQSEGRTKPALRTAGLCGEGHALYELGKKEKDAGKLRDAQQKLAQAIATDLLAGTTTAKALYFLGQTLLTLGEGKEGKDYAQRADLCFQEVADYHAGSRWAALAQQALKR